MISTSDPSYDAMSELVPQASTSLCYITTRVGKGANLVERLRTKLVCSGSNNAVESCLIEVSYGVYLLATVHTAYYYISVFVSLSKS